MMEALEGIQVVEFGQFISAAFCARLLADFGAEVIKVEPPGGDKARRHGPFPGDVPHPERSGLFLFLNTNKKGITLDASSPTGRQLLLRLLAGADILVSDYPPPRMEEWGLTYERLREVNPRLIMTTITPYGWTGPYRNYKAYDINIGAVGGVTVAAGRPDREPLNHPLNQSHYQGGIQGAIATMLALFAREVTGRGQHVDLSEAEAWHTFHLGSNLVTYLFSNRVRRRAGHRTETFYPYCILPCKDGYFCLIAMQMREWERFLHMIGDPEWAQNPRYQDRAAMGEEYPDEVDALLLPWLMAHTKEEIFRLCQEHKVPFGPVRTVDELVHDPHLNARGFFVEVEHKEAGRLKYPWVPYRFSRTPARLPRPAPLLGEHNEEVYLGRLGLSREELARLGRAGII